MSFSLTTPQMIARTKTVTRRLGWEFLRAGDLVCAVEKCQGLKKGERIKTIGVIEVVDVRRDRLNSLTDARQWPLPGYGRREVDREGFPHFSIQEFVDMFCAANGCAPDCEVTRIAFRHVEAAR